MPKIISTALITQEQMNVNTAFDFICLCTEYQSKDQRLCLISPQRARKEVAKRESIPVAKKVGSESILFIRDNIRFVPETLNRLEASGKEVIGCKTKKDQGLLTSDLLLVKMGVFDKIKKPWFATDFVRGTIDTIPDYHQFFNSCKEAGIECYCEDKLSEDNLNIKPIKNGEIQVNARTIQGGNPFGKKVAIAFPAEYLIYTHTASDIAQMVGVNIGLYKSFTIINAQSDEIETARNISVEVARQTGCDYIAFIDSDMRFPENTLNRLIKRGKEIIGVNAVKRDGKGQPIFRKNLLGKLFNYKKGEAEKVPFIGMGFTLIDMKVFDKMEKPWFFPIYEIGTDNWRGEDFMFCREAKEAGNYIWCDVGLSKEIGHIGSQAYYLGVK